MDDTLNKYWVPPSSWYSPYLQITAAILIDRKGFKKLINHPSELHSFGIEYNKYPPKMINIPYWEAISPFKAGEFNPSDVITSTVLRFQFKETQSLQNGYLAIYEQDPFTK